MTTLTESLARVQRAPSPKPRIVERNTFRYVRPDGAEVTRLHHTDIVVRRPDGRVELDSGGWRTMTTKGRMNTYATPYVVFSKDGVWHVAERGGTWSPEGRTVPFFDGMVLPDALNPSSVAFAHGVESAADERRLKKQLGAFLKIVRTVDYLPRPDAGDCWLCALRSADGRSMGEGDHSHLRSHIEEGYLHGSLIVNALREAGWTDVGLRMAFDSPPGRHSMRSRVANSVGRYLKRRLGLAL